MAELKTKVNDSSVEEFINSVDDETKRSDSFTLLEIMKKATGTEPKMWGESIIGFGTYHYKYASGQEGDWPVAAFSPRKQNLSVYFMPGFDKYDKLLGKLGKFKTAKSCLYIKKLKDVDLKILEDLVKTSVKDMKKLYM